MKKILLFLSLLFISFAVFADDAISLDPTKLTAEQREQLLSKTQSLGHVVAGNFDTAKVKIIELYDPLCGDCHKAYPQLMALEKKYPGIAIKVIPLNFISRNTSGAINTLMDAAYQQGHDQGNRFYHAVMTYHGKTKLDENAALALAKDIKGLDIEQLKKDAAGQAAQTQLAQKHALIQSLNVKWVPMIYVISGRDGWQAFAPDKLGSLISSL